MDTVKEKLMHKFTPQSVTTLDLAFGGDMKKLMPKNVPPEFMNGQTQGNKFFSDMFYCGLKNAKLIPQDGIDAREAVAHIRAIAGSFDPKHEHKEAAVAYLFSIWFKPESTWERAK